MSAMVEIGAMAIRDECQRRGYLVSIPATANLWEALARTAIVAIWRAMIDEALK
jgi:hypothetical protein